MWAIFDVWLGGAIATFVLQLIARHRNIPVALVTTLAWPLFLVFVICDAMGWIDRDREPEDLKWR